MKRFRWFQSAAQDSARDIGFSLMVLVLAAVLPLLVFGGGVAWTIVQQKQAAVEAELAGTARALRVAVDRELLSQFSAMQVLATDPSMDVEDLRGFSGRVRQAMETHAGWRNVVLFDPDSHAIVAGGLPIPLPHPIASSPAAVDEVVRTRQPTIVGLLGTGKIVRQPVVQFLIPVVRQDKVRFVMGLVMEPKSLNELFQAQGLPASWTGAIVDSHMILAGRSRDPGRYVGNRATPTLVDRIAASESGLFTALNQEGATVYTVFSRSPATGWSVAIGVPAAEIEAPIRTTLMWLLAGGASLMLFALGLTGLVGRNIVRRRNDYETALRDEIAERKRTAGIIERERLRLETILKTAGDGIYILNEQGVLVEANRAFLDMLGYDSTAIGTLHVCDWEAQYAWADIKKSFVKLITERGKTIVETRHRRKDGVVIDVEISASAIEFNGEIHLYAASRDITARKQAEQQLRIAATAFESQEGLVVTDAERTILRVNQAFTEITGFTAEEAIGRKTNLLKSGRHDADFYQAMWASLVDNGSWQGEIWNRRKNGEIYPEWLTITAVKDGAGAVTHYVATLTDITHRKAAEDEIKHLAYYDPLTGLPNRRLLLDRLHCAMASSTRSGHTGALLFIDLDNFKTLNDTLGHHVGDLLLQQVANRLRACVRESDSVARLGGDEFVVMLEELSANPLQAAAQTETVGQEILASLNHPYQLLDHPCHSTPSIGATLFRDHEEAIDEILKRADLAMYKAKAAGRNTMCFFDPEMQASVAARAALELDLRRGLQHNQFILHYQPQVNSRGDITGVEALVRWQHPQRGLVSPGNFIALAEETGLIIPLGQQVLEMACRQLALWARQGGLADMTIAVNVSAKQFHYPAFVKQVLAILEQTGANPQRLTIELTESMLLEAVDEVVAKMTMLVSKGINFSLDDFGTGYSSLSYLKRLPLYCLKIDQSFVRDILTDANDAAIAGTIVALAQHLGLSVIAEGVETQQQRDLLEQLGCHAYQGYFFSRPLPIADIERYIDAHSAPSLLGH